MKTGNRFRLVLLALATFASAQAGPLKVETGPATEWQRDLTKQDPDAPSMLSQNEAGQVKPKSVQLWSGERLIFEAKAIDARCVSKGDAATAVWAVSAVTGDLPPMRGDGEDTGPDGEASPREIWVIPPDGKPRRLSRADMDATHPVISPDGRYVAFTACPFRANQPSGEEAAYLVSVASGEIVELAHKEGGSAYLVRATGWSADSRSVTIADFRGEMSSYGTRRTVTVLP